MHPSWQHGVALFFMVVWATLLLRHALLPNYTILPLDLIHTIAPWTTGEAFVPHNTLISDPFYSFYPRRALLTDAIQNGQFPLWNPYIMTGTPIVANPNFQLFYPPNLLIALFLPADQALPWLAWGHLVLTGTLMYLFLRRHNLHWLACTLGGSVWLLNGYGLVWLENPHRLSTAAWIPGLFWAFETAVSQKSRAWSAVAGLILGLAILGGQMQFIFALGLVFGVYGLTAVLQTSYKEGKISWHIIGYMAIIAVIGLGIGSLIILPSAEFSSISQRLRGSADLIQASRWQFNQLITLFAPDFYGNPLRSAYWGQANYAEATAYFGVVALVLALMAPLLARKRPFTWRVYIITLIVILIISGSAVVRLFPLLPGGEFIVLTRLLFLVPLVGSWLAALTLDGLLQNSPSKQRQILAVGTAVFIIGALLLITRQRLDTQFVTHQADIWRNVGRGGGLVTAVFILLAILPKRPQAIGIAFVILAAVDLLQWGYNFNPISHIDLLYPANEITDFLAEDQSLYRTLPLQSETVTFGPNVLSLFGEQTLGGYTPLILADYVALYKNIDDDVAIDWMAPNRNMLVMSNFDPMISLLNVKYIVSAHSLPYELVPQIAQEGCDTEVFLGETAVSQSFITPDAGLNRLDIPIATNDAPPDSAVQFWLWRDEVNGELVAQFDLSASQLVADQPLPLFFAPVPDSAGQTFVWGMQGDSAISLCQSADGAQSFSAFATWLQQKALVDGVYIYENPNVLPRAFMVHHLTLAAEDDVLARLNEANWWETAVFSQALPPEQMAQLAETPIRTPSEVTVTDYQLHNLSISVNTPQAGVLVLADAYYPGWQATINGDPTPIYQTNQTQRGIFVPSGNHTIEFHFRPTYLSLAVGLMLFSLISAVILWLTSRH